MNKVKKVIHRKLGKERAMGLAYCDNGEIHIDERLNGKEHLEICIHEMEHILNPKWAEIKVQGHATEIDRVLWEIGYRRVSV